MTFVGFHIRTPGNLVDPIKDEVVEENIMSVQVFAGLRAQRVNFA